ncbi:HD domain protein [uncultured archaeon]|nr:HD domain protein [uncultured archaeon]
MKSIPSRGECLELLKKYKVPQNVIAHCMKVNEVAMFLARKMKERGEKVNPELVNAASLLHDLDKIEDIRNGGGRHGVLSREILEKEGYPEVGKIAEKHTMHTILKTDCLLTLEEKIVFYADKRVKHDKIVSLDERFGYLRKTYPQYLDSINRAESLVKKLEKELMEKAGISADEIK